MKKFLIQIFIIIGVTSMAKSEIATLGGGCFWCVEAVYQRIEGIISVKPGYAGGTIKNPTYKQICTGNTGHAEVAKIEFDPSRITYSQILNVFWQSHDPTTLNRQGNDVGTQYRSVIFFHNESQKEIAKKSKIDADKFKKDMDDFLRGLAETPPVEGQDRVVYAGLPEHEETQIRLENGIHITIK